MYKVGSEPRIEKQETRLIALRYEIRVIHEFPLLHSSISVRYSTLARSKRQEPRAEMNAAP